MRSVPMIATSALEYGDRSIAQGERFDVRPIEAAALKYQNKARFATAADAEPHRQASPSAAPPSPPPAASMHVENSPASPNRRGRRRKTYRTREMVAEK